MSLFAARQDFTEAGELTLFVNDSQIALLEDMMWEEGYLDARYCVRCAPVAISDIHVPIFAVGTNSDHVAPWRLAHKIRLLTDAEVTFVLTSGGHNARIVSEPGHRGRAFQLLTRPLEGLSMAPDAWLAAAPKVDGS